MTTNPDKVRILRERARALAQPLAVKAAEPTLEVVEFSLANERYGIEVSHVREVFPFKELTPVPCLPAYMPGIVNVRGRMVAVLDLRRFFALPEAGIHDLHKVLILESDAVELGILADEVVAVCRLPLSRLQASLPTLTGVRERYLRGVTGEGLAVLDAGKLLDDEKLTVNEEVL